MITGPTGLITATCSVWRRPSGLRQKAPTTPAGPEALSGALCALCRPVGLSNQVEGGAGWGSRIPSSSKKSINFPNSCGTLGQSLRHSGWYGCFGFPQNDAGRTGPRVALVWTTSPPSARPRSRSSPMKSANGDGEPVLRSRLRRSLTRPKRQPPPNPCDPNLRAHSAAPATSETSSPMPDRTDQQKESWGRTNPQQPKPPRVRII
jgi:hypothetical protein